MVTHHPLTPPIIGYHCVFHWTEMLRIQEMRVCKTLRPNCMLVPKQAVCMIHLFPLNEVKFNFLKKLFGCLCFDLHPETECKLFAGKLEME